MYLLDAHTYELQRFLGGDIPDYAILSHTWGDDEVLFRDILRNDAETFKQTGFSKVKACCMRAIEDNLDFVWIDTCCIDSDSSAELSEAINSMYEWYKAASICYAYLFDVSENATQFKEARWFSRGWTLQELLAPQNIRFYDRNWKTVGDKRSLRSMIASGAGIQAQHLDRPDVCDFFRSFDCLPKMTLTSFQDASVAQKMSWVSKRQTTRREDIAYCLLGLFDVNMPLLYGEGETKAFLRLQGEIIKTSSDESIFAWRNPHLWSSGMLAHSPADFAESADIVVNTRGLFRPPYTMTNKGLEFPLLSWVGDFGKIEKGPPEREIIVPLACTRDASSRAIAVHFQSLKGYTDNSETNPIGLISSSRSQNSKDASTFDASIILMMRTRLNALVEYHDPSSQQHRTLAQQRFFIPDARSLKNDESYIHSILAKGQRKTPHNRLIPWDTQNRTRRPCFTPGFLFRFTSGTPPKLAYFESFIYKHKSQSLFEDQMLNLKESFDGDTIEAFAENYSYLWCYGDVKDLSMFFSWTSIEGSMPDTLPTPLLKFHLVKGISTKDGAMKFQIISSKYMYYNSRLTTSFQLGSGWLWWISIEITETQPPQYTISSDVAYAKGLQSFA